MKKNILIGMLFASVVYGGIAVGAAGTIGSSASKSTSGQLQGCSQQPMSSVPYYVCPSGMVLANVGNYYTYKTTQFPNIVIAHFSGNGVILYGCGSGSSGGTWVAASGGSGFKCQ